MSKLARYPSRWSRPGRSLNEVASDLDGECEWVVNNGVLPSDVVARNRHVAEAGPRPWKPAFMYGDLQVTHVFVDADELTGVVDCSASRMSEQTTRGLGTTISMRVQCKVARVKVLVIQGAGMNMRGKTEVEIFGPMTLEQVNDQVRGYAAELGIEVVFFHSNVEGEVCNALYAAHDDPSVEAALINPAGYMRTTGPLPNAIHQVRFPVIEVHVSNPVARGVASNILPMCKGSVTGFGSLSYKFGLAAVKELVAAARR